jgi:DNA-binding response OmpR family regulator
MTTGILSKDEGVASSAGSTASLRIAVLDRDSGFIQVLGKRMDRLGWEHRVLASPVQTDAIASMRLSALVVDLAVLGPAAWEWLERLCGALPELGIVVCTGPSTVAQRVRGLRLGADDWITKPCHPEEVIARVQGLVRRRRRATARTESKPVSAGEVEIRSDRFQAFVAGRSLELTRREFELIELLASGEGRVLEREEIYSRLWGYAMVRGDRSVDVFVRKLRQKLEKASPEWRYIHTHFGIGYRFAAELADSEDAQNVAAGESDRELGGDKAGQKLAADPGDHKLAADQSDQEPAAEERIQDTPGTAGLDLGAGNVGDQSELGRTQQEYELSTAGA